MIIQLCFQVKDQAHNDGIKEKLKTIKTMFPTDAFISCHLTEEICIAEGFNTDMVHALHQIFGDKYKSMVTASTFDAAMMHMPVYRCSASKIADKIIVVGEQSIANIALELQLFTENRVEFI